MPRVVVFRINRWLWAAATLNDYDQPGPLRFGLSLDSARMRAALSEPAT